MWLKANPEHHLRYLQFKAATLSAETDDAEHGEDEVNFLFPLPLTPVARLLYFSIEPQLSPCSIFNLLQWSAACVRVALKHRLGQPRGEENCWDRQAREPVAGVRQRNLTPSEPGPSLGRLRRLQAQR